MHVKIIHREIGFGLVEYLIVMFEEMRDCV